MDKIETNIQRRVTLEINNMIDKSMNAIAISIRCTKKMSVYMLNYLMDNHLGRGSKLER